ncbi:MAG: hypothetical protein AVDCRST_MAG91-859, partial [uncultured Sphingomonadaceae bacterium]
DICGSVHRPRGDVRLCDLGPQDRGGIALQV